MNANKEHFAEIIESSLHGWTAQSWQWDNFPIFGSIVSVEAAHRTLFGLVYQVHTGSTDPIHSPFPYKKTEEELLRDHPQIFEFLKTTFNCLIIGYEEKEKIYYLLAPEPSKIHAFVKHVEVPKIRRFFSSAHYLHLIFSLSNQVSNMDELLLAILYQLEQLKILDEAKLTDFIDFYSLSIGNDYRRLKIFLKRIEYHIKS